MHSGLLLILGGGGAGEGARVMTLHKLTAGDGYTYLTRQVAAQDATARGYGSLGEYYAQRGEAPGVWLGRGLSSGAAVVPDYPLGEVVTEAQMVALFGGGRHPNAEEIGRVLSAAGASAAEADRASRLGSPFRVFSAANEFSRRAAGAFRDYNRALGLPGDTAVPAADRARIRTGLARRMFTETYHRDPVDARELSGQLARLSRQATTAVAGYDLTFSPVKSVSVLWAIAPRAVAEVIERATADAVADTLGWLEDHAAYTRGRNGVAQVEVRGLIAAVFTHRDSRAGDPDLHTHVAVSNKVQTHDGRWLAVDGRLLYRNNVAASERYNTRLEALLIDRLGVTFTDRPAGPGTGPGMEAGKRAVREIVGVDGPLPRRWSSRRAAIEARRGVLAGAFQAEHGRPPTATEAIGLAQRANLETRARKHEPRSPAEQRAAWHAEAVAVLGGEPALAGYLRGALGTHPSPRREGPGVTAEWRRSTAGQVLATVSAGRAVWQEHHVRAEAERVARSAGIRLADLDAAVDGVVAEALSERHSVALDTGEPPTVSLPPAVAEPAVPEPAVVEPAVVEPAVLRRSDGSSVYTVAGSRLFTSAAVLAAEEAIVAAGGRRDGRRVSAAAVAVAVRESAAHGVTLNPGQAQLVSELATSGARVQLALAPAGTGKTTALRVLARAWTSDPGGAGTRGTVLGLAPSAAAAAVLREETGARTDTLAKLRWHLRDGSPGPAWMQSIGPATLVLIDEAGMAGTLELAAVIGHVVGRGGSVRLIGDDQQLAAIGAGGVLRDLAAVHGAVTLSQVMRFTDPDTHGPGSGGPNHAEGAASLALRAGDPAALAYYTDHQRVHVGDLSTATDAAYTGWQADVAAGADAIMLAPTRDLVAGLNARAQQDRVVAPAAPAGQPGGGARRAQRGAGGRQPGGRRGHRDQPPQRAADPSHRHRLGEERGPLDGGSRPGQRRPGRGAPADRTAGHPARGLRADPGRARLRHHRAQRAGRHGRQLPHGGDRDGEPAAVLRRDDSGPARQPRLPRHRRRWGPAQRQHRRRAAPSDRRRDPDPGAGPRPCPRLGRHHRPDPHRPRRAAARARGPVPRRAGHRRGDGPRPGGPRWHRRRRRGRGPRGDRSGCLSGAAVPALPAGSRRG